VGKVADATKVTVFVVGNYIVESSSTLHYTTVVNQLICPDHLLVSSPAPFVWE
jgi:hypothetical protein